MKGKMLGVLLLGFLIYVFLETSFFQENRAENRAQEIVDLIAHNRADLLAETIVHEEEYSYDVGAFVDSVSPFLNSSCDFSPSEKEVLQTARLIAALGHPDQHRASSDNKPARAIDAVSYCPSQNGNDGLKIIVVFCSVSGRHVCGISAYSLWNEK